MRGIFRPHCSSFPIENADKLALLLRAANPAKPVLRMRDVQWEAHTVFTVSNFERSFADGHCSIAERFLPSEGISFQSKEPSNPKRLADQFTSNPSCVVILCCVSERKSTDFRPPKLNPVSTFNRLYAAPFRGVFRSLLLEPFADGPVTSITSDFPHPTRNRGQPPMELPTFQNGTSGPD
jgi:hypothetical protein